PACDHRQLRVPEPDTARTERFAQGKQLSERELTVIECDGQVEQQPGRLGGTDERLRCRSQRVIATVVNQHLTAWDLDLVQNRFIVPVRIEPCHEARILYVFG